jgi:CheY-like chemotaxis protein
MEISTKNIVIADDDSEDVELFSQALTEVSPGSTLSIAENGQLLMNLLKVAAIPDLIVLDLDMPFKSGQQCLKEIRSQEKFNKVPVVVLSTSKRVKEVERSVCKGLNYFFMKPWSYADLKKLVNQICQGKFAEIAF